MKSKTTLIAFIAIVIFFLYPSFNVSAQDVGYEDYKVLGKEYFKFLMQDDTLSLSKMSSKKFWVQICDCHKMSGDTSGSILENMIRNDYNKFFTKLYIWPFKKFGAKLKDDDITNIIVDSVSLKRDTTQIPPCKGMAVYYIQIAINSNHVTYKTSLGITKYEGKWLLLDPSPTLSW